jgi:oxygen-independent coproporphyrinogen-3 oxidase
MNDLLAKYNRQGPRYTSYPPVPFWKNAPDESEWINHLKLIYSEKEGMDLYVHVPFCEKLCYYCGCNRIVTKNHSVQDNFVDLLLLEWQTYCDRLGFIPTINSLHFGGGTPTFLTPENLEKLIVKLTLNKKENFSGSIEIDPRNTSLEHLDCFKKNGIKRVSLGIQDFDPLVQKAINRDQSFELVEKLVHELRIREFESINFDVIYGLPKQTKETIIETFRLIRKLKPDLIAYYSYAHLPDRLKNQRLINPADLPEASEKQAFYELGKDLLAMDGYADIGMDHFALPTDALAIAKRQGRLHRNFQGYSTQPDCDLIGLGVSSIGRIGATYSQNAKTLEEYYDFLNQGRFPVVRGLALSRDDLVRRAVIMALMCQGSLQYESIELAYMIDFKSYFAAELEALKELEKTGMVVLEESGIQVTDFGWFFVRAVAMLFDRYLQTDRNRARFSKII